MAYRLPIVFFVCWFGLVWFGSLFVCLFDYVFLARFPGCRSFAEVPVYSVGNRQAQSEPDSLGSVLFSTSLITTFLPVGHGSSSPFPRVEPLAPGCRKETIDGTFLRTIRRERQQRGPSLQEPAAFSSRTRAALEPQGERLQPEGGHGGPCTPGAEHVVSCAREMP